MTKHRLVAKHNADDFTEEMDLHESKGWQAVPSTFGEMGSLWFILMFKVEPNDPYRTEATP